MKLCSGEKLTNTLHYHVMPCFYACKALSAWGFPSTACIIIILTSREGKTCGSISIECHQNSSHVQAEKVGQYP